RGPGPRMRNRARRRRRSRWKAPPGRAGNRAGGRSNAKARRAVRAPPAAGPRRIPKLRSEGRGPRSRYGYDESRAGPGADPPVAVRARRVEIDGVAAVENEIVSRHAQCQLALENVQKFHAGMLLRARLLGRDGLEFGVIRVQPALDGGEVQRLEEEGDVLRTRLLGEALSIPLTHDGDGVALAVPGDEVIEPAAEHESDAQEGRKRGEEAAPLDLGEERRGEAGVAAELHEPHVLRKAETAQLVADGIDPKTLLERRRQHFSLLFEPQSKRRLPFDRDAHEFQYVPDFHSSQKFLNYGASQEVTAMKR